MKRLFALALLLLPCGLPAQHRSDALLGQLEQLIGQRDRFAAVKEQRLSLIKHRLTGAATDSERFSIYLNLYKEYRSYCYDSAFCYIERAKDVARRLGSGAMLASCRVEQSFVFISAGLFKEAIDTLDCIDRRSLPDSLLLSYYGVASRAYSDMADYAKGGVLAERYLAQSSALLSRALALSPRGSFERWLNEGVLLVRHERWGDARRLFEGSIARGHLSHQQMGVAASYLSYVYLRLGDTVRQKEWLVRAAMADVKGSTHETVALRDLALLLFRQGDIERAYRFITVAMDDARLYNARQRKVELAAIVPIIEGERMAMVEQQRRSLMWFSMALGLLALVVVAFAVVIYQQLRRIRRVKTILQDTNLQLGSINKSLEEANRIKNEYIGFFFSTNSEYIARMEAFQKSIHRKIVSRQLDDLSSILKSSDLKKERELLFRRFDSIFLKLFPSFVEEFNALFDVADRVEPKAGELSPEMRIFALMRLGIRDNEKIARFLNYSMTTIYTYKTKAKAKSIDRDGFEERIMRIGTYR